MDSQDLWYFVVDSEEGRRQDGPVPADTLMTLLASEKITPETLVWREGMADWEQICNIPDFAVTRVEEAEPILEVVTTEPLEDLSVEVTAEPAAAAAPAAAAEPAVAGPAAVPPDSVVIKDIGAYSICYSKARNVLVVYSNGQQASPLEMTKLDLLDVLTALETAGLEGVG